MHSLRLLSVATAVAILAILAFPSVTAQEEPLLPHLFYGRAFVGDTPVPAGTPIEARGPGITTGIPGNPVFVGEDGRFGGPGSFEEKLMVSGNITANTPIYFTVGGARALCRAASLESPYSDSYSYTPSEQTEIVLLVEGSAGRETSTVSTGTPATSGAAGTLGGGGGGTTGSLFPTQVATGEPATGTHGTVPAPTETPLPRAVTTAGVQSTVTETVFPSGTGENTPAGKPRTAGDPVPSAALLSLGLVLTLVCVRVRER